MRTIRASAGFHSDRSRVEFIATDAMESALPPLKFKRTMVTAIVKKPEYDKNHGDQHAINHSGGGEFEHRG